MRMRAVPSASRTMGIERHRGNPAHRSWSMADQKQGRERADRDKDRSEEAHWRVAEAGAEKEEEERLLEAASQSDEQQKDCENEGGARERDP